ATSEPCSSPRAIPRTLTAAPAQSRAHARNTLPLSPHSALATAARFRRLCDGYRLRATFLWLFPPPLFLRQCSAERYRIGRVQRRLSPNMTSAVASTVLIPLTARR